jgi:hypothetical protein
VKEMACLLDIRGTVLADFEDCGDDNLAHGISDVLVTLSEEGIIVLQHTHEGYPYNREYRITEEGVFRKYLFWDLPVAFFREQSFVRRPKGNST